MKKVSSCIVALIVIFVLSSCASQKNVLRKPSVQYHGATFTKAVKKEGNTYVPENPQDTFYTTDSKVITLLNFENLSGKHKLKWEWYDPSGKLYYTTNDFHFQTATGKYVKVATPYHAISILGDAAAGYTGRWKVKVYLNNELLDSKQFVLAENDSDIALPDKIPSRPFPKDWGLIIGIENYANLPSVSYAKKDALIMKEYFMKVFGVPEKNIISLIDGDATKSRIQGFIKQYIPKNVDTSTTLYVYFAGHGAPDIDKGDPYIIPYDGDTRFLQQTGYNLKQFYGDLEELNIQKSYVFLDSCFSGVAARAAEMLVKNARPALLKSNNVDLYSNTIISLSASSQGQVSNSYPEREHGLFTYYLLKAIKGEADEDEDRWISVKEVYKYVKSNVIRVSRRMGVEQTPIISPDISILKDVAIGRVLN